MTSETESTPELPTELGAVEGVKYYAAALVRTDRGRWAITVSLLLSIIDIQINGTYSGLAGEFHFGIALWTSIFAAGLFLVLLDFIDGLTGRWEND